MTKVYIIKNQNNYFLNRQNEWVEPAEAQSLYRTPHKDEAINTKVEYTVKNPELRIQVIHCDTNDKGIPQLAEYIAANEELELTPPAMNESETDGDTCISSQPNDEKNIELNTPAGDEHNESQRENAITNEETIPPTDNSAAKEGKNLNEAECHNNMDSLASNDSTDDNRADDSYSENHDTATAMSQDLPARDGEPTPNF